MGNGNAGCRFIFFNVVLFSGDAAAGHLVGA
jgi:hypothetical protein